MRIVAFSDTHQNTALFINSVQQAIGDGRIDVFIHCGDGVRDLACVEGALREANPDIRILAIRGNCDLGAVLYPETETADLGGVRTMITHGNAYDVKHGLGKLVKAVREMNATLVFFGHTHRATVARKHGVTLINPGSLASWSLTNTAYLEVVIDRDAEIHEKFIPRRVK